MMDGIHYFRGIISQADGQNSNDFFIVTESLLLNLEAAMKETFNEFKQLEKMFWIPCISEKFFIYMPQEGLFRCERTAGSIKEEISYKLIDVGEKVFSAKFGDFYLMPKSIKEIPALAKKYRWSGNNVTGCENFDSSKFLVNSVYQTFDFEVLTHQNDVNIVNIWKIPEDDEKQNEKLRKSLMNEENCTENAMIAIQGFSTRDDINRCMHYDAATQGCFKKGRCKLNHVQELEEGVYRDKKEIFYFNHFLPLLPVVSRLYDITITAFSSINRFFCQFSDNTFYNGHSFKTLCKKLNDEKEVKNYQKLSCLPAIGEIVMIKLMINHENTFYRGKVMNLCDSNSCVSIFLLDEGNIIKNVHIKSLYEYCARFSAHPFFAIEMEIANIAPSSEVDKNAKGINLLMDMQKESEYQLFKALIIQNIPTTICHLFEKRNSSIADLLITKGFAIRKPSLLVLDSRSIIPV